MKKKNLKILWNYIKMILNIRNIKKNLKTLQQQNTLLKKLWTELINDPQNTPVVLKTYKKIKNNSEDLQILQNYLIYLLKNFDEICRKNNLKYWLRGGSLLGAIRHEGFIPWDDDLDVGMTRIDFNKLEEILNNTNTDFKISYYYNTTTAICRMPRFINATNNILGFIDIFPFDYCTENKNQEIIKYQQKQKNIIEEVKQLTRQNKIGKYSGLMHENFNKDVNILNKIFDKHMNYTQKENSCLIYPFDWFKIIQNLYYSKNNIFPLKETKFNELNVFIPNEPEFILKTCYGNYLMPPESLGNHTKAHKLLDNIENIRNFLINIS